MQRRSGVRGGTESFKKNQNFLGGCVNMIFTMFSVSRVNSNRVHRMLCGGGRGGFAVHALELPSFGTENHYFSKGELWGFSFDVVWGGYCARQCGRTSRARWECAFACECVCVCVRARAGVRVTWQGHISQRAAGPDVWLPLTARSRRGWSGEGPAPSGPPTLPAPLRSPGQKPGPA